MRSQLQNAKLVPQVLSSEVERLGLHVTYHWAYYRIGRNPMLLTTFSTNATIILRYGHHLQAILATELGRVVELIQEGQFLLYLYIYL